MRCPPARRSASRSPSRRARGPAHGRCPLPGSVFHTDSRAQYAATRHRRILKQNGFDAVNLNGGYKTYSHVTCNQSNFDTFENVSISSREEIQEIVWAGNPDKPLAEDSLAPQLAPRRSFERWVELRQGVCRPWNNQDRLHCMHLRNALLGALGA